MACITRSPINASGALTSGEMTIQRDPILRHRIHEGNGAATSDCLSDRQLRRKKRQINDGESG
jgi:hypothetical protein